jgi:ribosomal protein S16
VKREGGEEEKAQELGKDPTNTRNRPLSLHQLRDVIQSRRNECILDLSLALASLAWLGKESRDLQGELLHAIGFYQPRLEPDEEEKETGRKKVTLLSEKIEQKQKEVGEKRESVRMLKKEVSWWYTRGDGEEMCRACCC